MYNINDFKIGVIYKYTSPSGKIYIGKTVDEKARKGKHKQDSKRLKTYFARAILKYGFENFKYEVIIKFSPTLDIEKLDRVLNKLEQRYIKLYNSCNKDIGYNLTKGGEGACGYTHTKEALEKMRIASTGKKHTEETKAYISKCAKELGQDPEIRKLRSEVVKENHRKGLYKNNHRTLKTRKQVFKYSLEKEFLGKFDSISAAAKTIETGTLKTRCNRISEVCNGHRKTSYNFIWSFSEI